MHAAWSFCFSVPHPSSEHSKSLPRRGRLQRGAQLFIVLVFIVARWGTKWAPQCPPPAWHTGYSLVVGCSEAGDCGIAAAGRNCPVWEGFALKGWGRGLPALFRSSAQGLAVLVMVALRWAKQVRGGENTVCRGLEKRDTRCPAGTCQGWRHPVEL